MGSKVQTNDPKELLCPFIDSTMLAPEPCMYALTTGVEDTLCTLHFKGPNPTTEVHAWLPQHDRAVF